MDQILQSLEGIVCNMDMLVTGKSDKNLKNVLSSFQEFGFKANLHKCSFLQDSVICGIKISKNGLKKNKYKTEVVDNVPAPSDKK